jgi:hypothetical protein
MYEKVKTGDPIFRDRHGDAGSTRQSTTKDGGYMYVPPLASVLKAICMTREEFESSRRVTVSAELLKLLLQIALANSDFNEPGYLRDNPDIAQAIRSATLEDPRLHYVAFGFFEGRSGATPEVDEAWYLRTYADVAQGVRSGRIRSATEHFRVAGASEGRSPNATYSLAAAQWKKALQPIYETV